MLARRLARHDGALAALVKTRSVYLDAFRDQLQTQMEEMRAAFTYKSERVLTSAQREVIMVKNRDSSVLNFCANNYLGLSNHSELVMHAKQAMDQRGFGLSSVRFICGTQDIHKELEDKLSAFHGTEDTIMYPSCFDANAGLFEALLGPEDAIFSDALNHASIIDGVRLCRAQRHRYNHLDMTDLEQKLQSASDSSRFRLIATDGSFSMDGDIAPLSEIVALARKHSSLVFVDDCHGTGLLGETGRGSLQTQGIDAGDIDVLNSTLGKALGGATGGYSTGRKEIIEILRQKSRPYLFSNALMPAVVGASSYKLPAGFVLTDRPEGIAAIDMLMASSHLVRKLARNTALFRSRMKAAGFKVLGDDRHPIAPVLLGRAHVASPMADELLARGIYVIAFSYPVVPKDEARIRVQLSAAHSTDQVNAAVDAFITVGQLFGVI